MDLVGLTQDEAHRIHCYWHIAIPRAQNGKGTNCASSVLVIYGLTRGDWTEGALAGIAASMALIPEEFPVIMLLFLTIGAWRLSKKKVITRRAPAIETLGSATVICVDKTGTLTMNQMAVQEINVNGELHVLNGEVIPSKFREVVQNG